MGATDVEALSNFPGGGKSDKQSIFMDVYAEEARVHMETYGTSIDTFAKIAGGYLNGGNAVVAIQVLGR